MRLVISNTRRLARASRAPSFLSSDRLIALDSPIIEPPQQWRNHSISSLLSGLIHGNCETSLRRNQQCSVNSMMVTRAFSSEVISKEGSPTGAVKELYDKIIQSIKAQTCPPNAMLWSLIENCKNCDDIKLLFEVLEHLRRFRLSNLRIHSDFNCNLCREITKACVRVGALDFGKKALWKHNVYGLSPSIGSAHQLLLYAKEHNDAKLMDEVMKLLKKNDLPLQPGTADIVFGICYIADDWQLLSKYTKNFVKAGVKLRQTAFEIWMEFAAKIGDTESLWGSEKLRSEVMKKHTLRTGFSCVKGFLLERKPENAAAVVQLLNQELSDSKKFGIAAELGKLVSEWPLEVIKHQKKEDRKALVAALQTDIPVMVSHLANMDLEVNASMEELTKQEGILY